MPIAFEAEQPEPVAVSRLVAVDEWSGGERTDFVDEILPKPDRIERSQPMQ